MSVNIRVLRELSSPRRMYESLLMERVERELWEASFSGRHDPDSARANNLSRIRRVAAAPSPAKERPVTDIKFRVKKYGFKKQYCSVEIECFGVTSVVKQKLKELSEKRVNQGMISIGSDSTIQGAESAEIRISYAINEYRRVYDVCNILRDHKVQVNKSCGLHVHFDGSQLKDETALTGWIENQDWIFKLVSKSRRSGNRYCMKNTYDNKGERYLALNMTAKSRHGTLEVRLHHGSLNPDKIRSWTDLCHYILTQGRTWKNVQGFCADNTVPLHLRQFAWERYGELNVMVDSSLDV